MRATLENGWACLIVPTIDGNNACRKSKKEYEAVRLSLNFETVQNRAWMMGKKC